jgi:hypothetical protein
MPHPVTPWAHDRPVRNNNPGDLRTRHTPPPWPGQVDVDDDPGGPFAIFATPADGWAALALWCLDARYLRGLHTAPQMINVFAPPADNNPTSAYAQFVSDRVGAGDLDLTDPDRLAALCRAIACFEDGRASWNELEVQSGLLLASARWPEWKAARLGDQPPMQAVPVHEQTAPLPADPAIEIAGLSDADRLNQAELDRLHREQGTA